jgi:hypothetical protein
MIFNEKSSTPVVTAVQICGFIEAFPHHIKVAKQRDVLALEIDESMPWGFYDGSALENNCGGGAILHLSLTHSYHLFWGLGEGGNNYAEIMSLKLLLIFAKEIGCK